MSDRLAKYAKPHIDDARLARQWAAISKPRRLGPSGRLVLVLAFAVAVVLVVGWRYTRPASVTVVARLGVTELESNGSESTLVLGDGSRITTKQRSHVVLQETTATSTRVELLAGSADFDVKHVPGRTFTVVAHDVMIVDVGTHFRVEYGTPGHDVRVSVFEGSVRVERDKSPPSNLIAGDSWVSGSSESVTESASAPVAVVVENVAVEAGHAAMGVADDSFARFEALAERDPGGAFEVFGVMGYPHAIERATPKQLFELGNAARLSEHPLQAANAFDALRSHRDDPRAGLAAMQLARLREDTLHDPVGAEAALRDAITLAPDPTLREDAEARRVGILQIMNDHSACVEAREAYLAKYPAGIHRASVEKRCGGR